MGEEQGIEQLEPEQLMRFVTGQLISSIHSHGPITASTAPSAAKRVVGQLRQVGLNLSGFPEEEMRRVRRKQANLTRNLRRLRKQRLRMSKAVETINRCEEDWDGLCGKCRAVVLAAIAGNGSYNGSTAETGEPQQAVNLSS